MSHLLTSFALAALLAGCDQPESSTPSEPQTGIISVQPDDADMNTAMQTARDHFPDFWVKVSTDHQRPIPALGSPMVKAYFYDSDAPHSGEHMWVSEVHYDGKTISGVLIDTPGHLRSVRSGDPVSFPLQHLSDWLYVEDGKATGAFTVKLLRTRMTPEQRQAHDSHYPFRFE